jgi:SAM-dependent methyltransferase
MTFIDLKKRMAAKREARAAQSILEPGLPTELASGPEGTAGSMAGQSAGRKKGSAGSMAEQPAAEAVVKSGKAATSARVDRTTSPGDPPPNSLGEAGTSKSGKARTGKSGNAGTSTSGEGGTSTTGEAGTSMSGEAGTSTSGEAGTSTTGEAGTSMSGEGGTSTTGEAGTSMSGEAGTSTSGDAGTSMSGNAGTSKSGMNTVSEAVTSTVGTSTAGTNPVGEARLPVQAATKPVRTSPTGALPAPDQLMMAAQFPPSELPEPEPMVPVLEWDTQLLLTVAETLPRGQDVLLMGLGPWGRAGGGRSLPEALHGRTRFLVALDPDKNRLAAVRGYCQRTLEANFHELANPELIKRLGGPRFGVVVISDALVLQADPMALLRSLRALLTPEGQLMVVVPNSAHADRRLALLAGEWPREFEPGSPVHHYTRERLRELLAFAGYTQASVTAYESDALSPQSGLVAELFPPAVIDALGPTEDARAAYFVGLGTPAPMQHLLRQLFDEQEALRRAVRNELAVVARSHGELQRQLLEAVYTRDQALVETEEARRKEAALNELIARAEQNVRRLGKEVDDGQRELVSVKAGFWYRLGQLFRKQQSRPLEFASAGSETWKYDPEYRHR